MSTLDLALDSDAAPFPLTLVTQTAFDKFAYAAVHGYSIVNSVPTSSIMYMEGEMSIQGSTPDIFVASAAGYQKLGAGQQAAAVGATYGLIAGGIGGAAGMTALALTPVGPLIGVAVIATVFGAPSFTGPRVCSMVIANGLDGDLSRAKDGCYLDCGTETHYPALFDMTHRLPGFSHGHTINGAATLPLSPPIKMYGAGVYRFENKRILGIGFMGTGGAIAFVSSDPRTKGKTMAIAWLVPETGKRGLGVTGDLEAEYGTLDKFYSQTADQRTINGTAVNDYYTVHAAFFLRQNDEDDQVLTVCITHGNK